MLDSQDCRQARAGVRPGWMDFIAVVLACIFPTATAHAEPRVVELAQADRTLLANLGEADGKGKDAPLVLMVHGTFAHKDMELMKALQTALQERGVHSLAVTLSYGQDRRKGPRDCKLPITDTYADAREEISAWIKWLSEQGFQNTVLLGHSRGGARVAEFLSLNGKSNRIKGAVLLAPATEKPGRFAREYRGSFSGGELTAFKSRLAAAGDDEMFDLPGFLYCPKARASAGAIRAYYGDKQVRDTPTLLKGIHQTDVLVIAAGADAVIKNLPEAMVPLSGAKNISFKTVDDADHLLLDFFAEDAADLIAGFTQKIAGH
ncbi:MAG: alpha/beta hydrolase [Hyphomicrobiaceae bacterium]